MKIEKLFHAYEALIETTPDVDALFEESGMINTFKKLDYGFFPLGSGILTDKSKIAEAEIAECRIMVLGNDFGTQEYLEKKCVNNREKKSNATIRNLVNETGLKLEAKTTFFSNLFLGVRKEGTNTKRAQPLKDDYKDFCLAFFKTQLELLNPTIVLCLGNEVSQSLSKLDKQFSNFSLANHIIDSHGKIWGKRRFAVIPHPSYAHINWKREEVKQRLKAAIEI